MTTHGLREVNAPYTVNPDDEAIGRETVIIRRNGEPVAAVVPYAEYQKLLALETPLRARTPRPIDPEFEKQWGAFERLLPELLAEHRGQWVGIMNEQAVVFGLTSSAVLAEISRRFGDVPMCIQEVREKPRMYHMGGPRIIQATGSLRPPVVITERDTETKPQSSSPGE